MLAARWIFSENVDKMRLFDPLEPFILIFVGSQQQQSVQHCLRRSVLGVAHWAALPATQPQSVTLIFFSRAGAMVKPCATSSIGCCTKISR
jgi:hypothetical protein